MSTTAEQAGVELMTEIGERLRTQDNRITQHPLFVVQQRRRIYGAEDQLGEDGHEWYETAEWERIPVDEAAELERKFDIFREVPDGYTRVAYADTWEFVTACFTEQGCKDFIAVNGHNLKDPRIYADSGWRNAEWIAIREYLMGLYPCGEES